MDFVAKIAEWIADHKGQTHAAAMAIVGAGLAYASSEQVQGIVNGLVGPHPRLIGIIGGLSALLLLYHQPVNKT